MFAQYDPNIKRSSIVSENKTPKELLKKKFLISLERAESV